MLEKLKALGDAAKGIVLWVLAPIFVLTGAIYILLSKNKSLKQDVARLESSKEVSHNEIQDQIDTTKAVSSLDKYRAMRRQYMGSGDDTDPPKGAA